MVKLGSKELRKTPPKEGYLIIGNSYKDEKAAKQVGVDFFL